MTQSGGDARSPARVALDIELLHYDFRRRCLACLRCHYPYRDCICSYANDLLEINRDWVTKDGGPLRVNKANGTVTTSMRIPRTRADGRPNNWNSCLPQEVSET